MRATGHRIRPSGCSAGPCRTRTRRWARCAASAAFFIPECLPDLADLTDEELRKALQTMVLHMLRVPSAPRE